MRLADVPPVPGVEHRHVQVNDILVHVAEAGRGPDLLLLHGWPQHWWEWRHLIPPLAKHYHVLAPDLRGWGWSDAPPGDYAKKTFAADILALLDSENIDRTRLIGHDWGGYTSFLLALEHPERIERMVCLDIPPPWGVRPQPRHIALPLFLSYQLLLATPLLGTRVMTSGNRFIRSIIRAGSARGARWSDPELDVYAEVLRERPRAAASSACYRTFLSRELPRTFSGRRYRPDDLTVPTLLLMGSESFLRMTVEPRKRRNLEVEEVARAGHFLPEEAPGQVLERALPFLSGGAES